MSKTCILATGLATSLDWSSETGPDGGLVGERVLGGAGEGVGVGAGGGTYVQASAILPKHT